MLILNVLIGRFIMSSEDEVNQAINKLLEDVDDRDKILEDAKKNIESLPHFKDMTKYERKESLYFRLKGLIGSRFVGGGKPIAISAGVVLGKTQARDRMAKKAQVIIERIKRGERIVPQGQNGAGEPLIDETTGIPWVYDKRGETISKRPMQWIASDFIFIAQLDEKSGTQVCKATVSGRRNKQEFAETFQPPEPGVYDFTLNMSIDGEDDSKVSLTVPKNVKFDKTVKVDDRQLDKILDNYAMNFGALGRFVNTNLDQYKPAILKCVFSGEGNQVYSSGSRHVYVRPAELLIDNEDESNESVSLFVPEKITVPCGIGSIMYVVGTFAIQTSGEFAGRINGNVDIIIPNSTSSFDKKIDETMFAFGKDEDEEEDIEVVDDGEGRVTSYSSSNKCMNCGESGGSGETGYCKICDKSGIEIQQNRRDTYLEKQKQLNITTKEEDDEFAGEVIEEDDEVTASLKELAKKYEKDFEVVKNIYETKDKALGGLATSADVIKLITPELQKPSKTTPKKVVKTVKKVSKKTDPNDDLF